MMPFTASAFLFDLNGTMIDDMEFHTRAWYEILNKDLGANLSWEDLKQEMYGKNHELLVRVFGPDRFTQSKMDHLSVEKEKRYQKEFFPKLQLINGLPQFLEGAKKGGKAMAIGSAAIPFNIDFVVDNLNIRHYFGAIVSADDVAESKPHPETFVQAATLLGVPPEGCIVFEDAPKGVEAAQHAGMKAIVLTTMHQPHEFAQYTNILAFIKDYTDPLLQPLLQV